MTIDGLDKEYNAGATLLDRARKYHKRPKVIRDMLTGMGVTIRPRGSAWRKP